MGGLFDALHDRYLDTVRIHAIGRRGGNKVLSDNDNDNDLLVTCGRTADVSNRAPTQFKTFPLAAWEPPQRSGYQGRVAGVWHTKKKGSSPVKGRRIWTSCIVPVQIGLSSADINQLSPQQYLYPRQHTTPHQKFARSQFRNSRVLGCCQDFPEGSPRHARYIATTPGGAGHSTGKS